MIISVIYDTLYFMFPAYCANAAPVIFGGGLPIDVEKKFFDGRDILGPRKTFRGFFMGLAVGTFAGYLQNRIFLGFVLSLGALFGDLIESFIKRRLNLSPGASFPFADQLDFVTGALVFSFLVSPPQLYIVITALIITPPLHFLTNFIAFRLGIKSEPW